MIDWHRLGLAVTFYKQWGFEYIETPWLADVDTIMLTCPDRGNVVTTNYYDQGLVGSAEQGFMELCRNGEKMDGKAYVSCGPCFRWEKPLDHIHHLTFMKVELFAKEVRSSDAEIHAYSMLSMAQNFMTTLIADKDAVKSYETDDGWDLCIAGIEVGSYGYRYIDNIGWWAYGTGLAEPRFTQAVEKWKTSK